MNLKKFTIILILFISQFTFAQFDDPGFGGDNRDPAENPVQTPIDNLLLPLLVTGILTTIYFVRKKERQLKQN